MKKTLGENALQQLIILVNNLFSQHTSDTGIHISALDRTSIDSVADKVDKVSGKGLSTNDYTTIDKNKLAGIADGANKTIVDSSLSTSSTNPVQNMVINTALDTKASLNSPIFTGTPKAPTAIVGTNNTQLATTEFVQIAISNGIAASDAMVIKGTIGTDGTITTLPKTYKTGWTYRVITPGTYASQVCEIGDLMIALIDRDGVGNLDSDWCVAQTNINGAITGIKGDIDHISISQSGSVVTISHNDVTRTNTTSSAFPAHGENFTAVKSIVSDSKGHITSVDTEIVTLPTQYVHPNTSGNKHIPAGGDSGQILRWASDGTAIWGPDNNTDTKVTNVLNNSTKAYITGTTTATTNTGTQIFDSGVYLDTEAGTLHAVKFDGTLNGNASSASKLTTARTIDVTGAVASMPTSFNGTTDINIPITSLNVDYLVNGSNVLILDGGQIN